MSFAATILITLRHYADTHKDPSLIFHSFQRGDFQVVTAEFLNQQNDIECQSISGMKKVDNDNRYDEESNEKSLHLKVANSDPERVFPNCCAICLEPYRIGDHIVWSCTTECRHVFHRDCLIAGLVQVKDNSSPCPCCRMQFCDLPNPPDVTHSFER